MSHAVEIVFVAELGIDLMQGAADTDHTRLVVGAPDVHTAVREQVVHLSLKAPGLVSGDLQLPLSGLLLQVQAALAGDVPDGNHIIAYFAFVGGNGPDAVLQILVEAYFRVVHVLAGVDDVGHARREHVAEEGSVEEQGFPEEFLVLFVKANHLLHLVVHRQKLAFGTVERHGQHGNLESLIVLGCQLLVGLLFRYLFGDVLGHQKVGRVVLFFVALLDTAARKILPVRLLVSTTVASQLHINVDTMLLDQLIDIRLELR